MHKNPSFREKTIHKLRPIHRVLLSLAAGGLTYSLLTFLILPAMLHLLMAWLSFCVCYLALCWYVIYTTPPVYIVKKADQEDGSKTFVFLFILIACFACLGAVLSIVINSKNSSASPYLSIPVSVISMILSWLLVHTLYIFHYAHLYYHESNQGEGLEFPGDKEQPDYVDFAYFSLVLGCTFQVSDVSITSKKIRHTALYHGLIAFALNTFVVALTINIVSGLVN